MKNPYSLIKILSLFPLPQTICSILHDMLTNLDAHTLYEKQKSTNAPGKSM